MGVSRNRPRLVSIFHFGRAAVLALALVAPLVTAINSGATSGASTPSTVPKCSYRQLELAVAWGPGAAAGNLGIPFIIANTSRTSCSLEGYPKFSFLPNRYQSQTLRVVHGGGMIFPRVKTRLVVIKPGADGSFGVNYGDAANQNDPSGAVCEARYVYVTLPVRINSFPQNYEASVDFNFCFTGFQVSETAIQSGPLPKEG